MRSKYATLVAHMRANSARRRSSVFHWEAKLDDKPRRQDWLSLNTAWILTNIAACGLFYYEHENAS